MDGRCLCGCGVKTAVSKKSNARYGYERGVPRRYLRGHATRAHGNNLEERFWKNVPSRPQHGCWMWIASTNGRYGLISKDRRHVFAHRVAYELTFGPIPAGLCCLHKCDIPLCVNPEHLFLGTHRDNSVDSVAKGRQSKTKLTQEQVLEIRRRANTGEKLVDLAAEFNVLPTNISRITLRQTWKFLGESND